MGLRNVANQMHMYNKFHVHILNAMSKWKTYLHKTPLVSRA